MDEQELERILQTATREVQTLGRVSTETADELAKAGGAAGNFQNAMRKGTVDVGRSMKGFTASVAKGETSFDTLIPIVDAMGGAFSGLIGSIPMVGQGFKKLGETATEVAKFLVTRLGQTVGAFQDVSRSGAISAGGLQAFGEQAFKTRLGLQGFSKVVTANSVALTRLSGSAFDGATVFGDAVARLTDPEGIGLTMRRLGFTAEEIGEVTANFVERQTRLGRAQTMTELQLAIATKQYSGELDQLTKLTGLSRQEAQAQQNQMLSETRFRARYQQLLNQQGEGSARALRDFVISVGATSPQLAAGIKDLFASGGIPITDAGKQLFQLAGGEINSIIQDILAGNLETGAANERLRNAMDANVNSLLDLAGKVPEGSTFLLESFASVIDFVNNSELTGEAAERAKQNREKLETGLDKAGEAAVKAQANLEDLNATLGKLSLIGLPAAATAIGEFTRLAAAAATDMEKIVKGEEFESEFSKAIKDLKDKSGLSDMTVEQMLVKAIKLPEPGPLGKAFNSMLDFLAKDPTPGGNEEFKNNPFVKNVMQDAKPFADGGKISMGDIGIVGERGPEIVYGPANVISTKETERIMNQMLSGTTTTNTMQQIMNQTTGPKISYTTQSPDVATMSETPAEKEQMTMAKDSSRSMEQQVDLLKQQVGKMDEMISILIKNNQIGERTYRSNLA